MIHACHNVKCIWPLFLADWKLINNTDAVNDQIAFRNIGRPRIRWDVMVNSFCVKYLGISSWSDLMLWPKADLYSYEDVFL